MTIELKRKPFSSDYDLYEDGKLFIAKLISIETSSYSVNHNISIDECRGYFIKVTAAATMKLPPLVAGGAITFYSTTAAAVSVDPDDADKIILDGVAGGAGKKITSASGAGDLVTLFGDPSDGWYVVGRSGAWTLEA